MAKDWTDQSLERLAEALHFHDTYEFRVREAAECIRQHVRQRFRDRTPEFGVVLGSGLGDLAAGIKDPIVIDYDKIPSFPQPTVHGHAGKVYIGELEDVPIIGLDLGRLSMSFGVELGTGGLDKSTRYFGILELGKNDRWNDNPCLMYSTYVKKDGRRYLHPFLVRGNVLRKDAANDLVLFMARSIACTNRTQEFFGHFSTAVRRFYKSMFPFSASSSSATRT